MVSLKVIRKYIFRSWLLLTILIIFIHHQFYSIDPRCNFLSNKYVCIIYSILQSQCLSKKVFFVLFFYFFRNTNLSWLRKINDTADLFLLVRLSISVILSVIILRYIIKNVEWYFYFSKLVVLLVRVHFLLKFLEPKLYIAPNALFGFSLLDRRNTWNWTYFSNKSICMLSRNNSHDFSGHFIMILASVEKQIIGPKDYIQTLCHLSI